MPRNGRNKKSRKKEEDKDRTPHIEREVKESVFGVIVLALAIVVALAEFGIAQGWLTRGIVNTSALLFGKASFLFPLVLFMAAVAILFSKKPNSIVPTVVGGGLIFASILGAFALAGNSASYSGGVVGFGVTWPFLKAVGFAGAIIFMVAFLISGALIAFRLPLTSYIREIAVEAGKDEEGQPIFGMQQVEEKGLLTAISGGIKKIKKPKAEPVPSAGETVTVNSPVSPAAKPKDADLGFRITPVTRDYTFPPLDLLDEETGSPVSGDIKANALIIQKTLENFSIPVEMAEVNVGPSVTQFTLKPATGVKLSKLIVLQNDLSLALAAHPVRIEAPIPGRSLVGIEIPNKKSMLVRLRGMFESFDSEKSNGHLSLALGKDVSGAATWASLAAMPHLLVAGATGAGKSVAIHAMMISLLYQHAPEMLRFILIDPKRVELTLYNGIPHLLTPVIVEPKKAVASFRWAVSEMERRYELLAGQGVRDIRGYNEKSSIKKNREYMPYLVIVIDELADLMAAYGREIEGSIVRLAQMARAVGIHLVLATQRPSVEVITGLIKANITARIAFQVASQVDSRTILDMSGAEKLLGKGDMLFLSPESSKPRRIQGTLISEKEVKKVVDFLVEHAGPEEISEEAGDLGQAIAKGSGGATIDLDNFSGGGEFDDDLFPEARELVVRSGKASASMLQRHLRVGYARAARLLDMLEEQGVVGPADGAKPREVLASMPAQTNALTQPSAPAGSMSLPASQPEPSPEFDSEPLDDNDEYDESDRTENA